MATATNTAVNAQTNYSNAPTTNVVSKEYYVKVPNRTKKRYHALKFHTSNVDMASWSKAEMARDMTNQLNQRPDWETMPKKGEGSEFGREAKEMAKRRRFGGHAPKKINPEDQPWVLSNKGGDKSAKQYIGKKSVSENSSYFVFIKCADGGFEAWPLEDWYSFAPHKTYKTLNHEEAEEEYKRRNKVLNKYTIMANKRKVDNVGDDEEGEECSKTGISTFGFTSKSGKDAWVSDGEEDSKKKKGKKNYKASNLSDDDDEDKDDGEDELAVTAKSKKKPKRKDIGSDDEIRAKEDSDEGDHDGIEKDYSSSDSDLDGSGPETSKFEEKYQQKGIDEEEAIKAQNKSDDSESEEDEDLTEEGKLYKKKLMAKDKDENESDEFEELFKAKGGKDEDSKDSSSSFDESDLESDIAKQKRAKLSQSAENNSKLKRKASDESLQSKPKKKAAKNQASSAITHDESSSSSSTSAPNIAKSTKTAAVIAAAKTAAAANTNKPSASSITNTSAAKASVKDSNNSGLSEEEVKRYLSRKPMTSKELLQKFKSKTQNTMTNQQLLDSLRAILDKLKAKMIEKNGVKYLSLP